MPDMSTPSQAVLSKSPSPPPAPAPTGAGFGGNSGNPKLPHRTSQFVLTSPITNSPASRVLATQPNTVRQLQVARQAQTQDPRVSAAKNKAEPKQVQPNSQVAVAESAGYALSFVNQPGVVTGVSVTTPNPAFAKVRGLRVPQGQKTQAAASYAFRVTS